MLLKWLFAKTNIVLSVASVLVLCGLLITSADKLRNDNSAIVKVALSHYQADNAKSFVQTRQVGNAQLFLHVLQSSPELVLLFVFALLSVRLLPYLALAFLQRLPWYCYCHPPSKLKVSLWHDSNILTRQTSHSLSL
ncbi:hypothetical protein HG263_05680 [Pseudoalteromonas sp. JBTF-M23]|uniref:Uncharacterized protein n=1 Tax=Pseudoalteromonas caenipelagi TaxID=2726988 RepID=A0A849VE72_9GAMM|nr:hypothetical protein [Pseudoalteromonas caenipelagi]NOU50027.1 hypothetical protein [Pseudoalteromonas caenipelagi]